MSEPIRQQAYQPCGDLLIETPGQSAPTNHRRWLDLDAGLAVTEWSANGNDYRRETFASHPADAVTLTGANAIEIRLTAATNVENWQSLAADPAKRVAATLARSVGRDYVKLLADHQADHRGLFRRVALDFGRTPAADLTTDQRIAGFRDGKDPHLAALLFQYGRYLLIGSSRAGGQPANLQGIWNESLRPPWDSKYTATSTPK